MYTSENHFNTRASDCAIEEVYTNLDIDKNCEYNPKKGYSFYYPYRFVNDPAQLKAVGVRRLDIIPTKHVINYTICIQPLDAYNNRLTKKDNDGNISEIEYVSTGRVDVTSSNILLEIVDKICEKINDDLTTKYGNTCIHKISYSYVDNNLSFYIDNETENIYAQFIIKGDEEFSKFLNQPINSQLSNWTDYVRKYFFTNVWDRSYIEFHASFSDSNRNFIGRNKTFYSRPSLFYLVPSSSSGFDIRFTSDGMNQVLPLYCRFIVQLTFVLNYKVYKI